MERLEEQERQEQRQRQASSVRMLALGASRPGRGIGAEQREVKPRGSGGLESSSTWRQASGPSHSAESAELRAGEIFTVDIHGCFILLLFTIYYLYFPLKNL